MSKPIVAKMRAVVDEVISQRVEDLRHELAITREQIARDHEALRAIVVADYDRIPELRERLITARQSPEYASTLADREPLVTVRIATYNRADILLERCLPAVLEQTYERLEIIVVGDGCDDDTGARLQRLGDPRVRFVNFPHRSVYPADPKQRWYVAGGPGMNHGAQLARGKWIAPVDDDDVFTPDHVERLVTTALDGEFELVYGKYWVVQEAAGTSHARGEYPPVYGTFSFGTAVYMSVLRFFEYDVNSWVLGEPADWNLCRRMLAAGVRMGFIDDVLETIEHSGPDQ